MNKHKKIILPFVLFIACLLFADPPEWDLMSGNEYTMTMYAEVTLYGSSFNNDDPNNILGAFGPGGEEDCRALGFWDQVGPHAMWYLHIVSNAEIEDMEPINFMIYNAADDRIYECAAEYQIYFANNDYIGSLFEPHQLTAPANLPPVGVADVYSATEDMPLIVDSADGVLANDNDPEGADMEAIIVDSTTNGTLQLYLDGSFQYFPESDFYGLDQFTYQAFDGELYSEITQVTINVLPVNDPPEFDFPLGGFNFDEDQDLIEDFSEYVTDPEGDTIISLTVSDNEYIYLEIAGLVVQFTAEPDWFGSENVTFTAIDSQGDSAFEEVMIYVNPVNDAPVIDIPFEQYTLIEDDSEIFDLNNYIYDVEEDSLELNVFDNDNISVSVEGFEITLIPDPDWFGSEVINFVVSDGELSDNDFVEIIVEPVNDAPQINIPQDEYSFLEDENLLLDLSDYISDVDDDQLQLVYSGNTFLNFNEISATVFNITAPLNWSGSELITFTITDTAGLEDSDQATITVIPVNDAPVINLPDNFTLDEDSFLMVDFESEGFVSDADSDSLSLIAAGINIQINISGLIVEFIPLPDWNGSENISFIVYDETLQSEDEVAVIVLPLNDPPQIDIEDSYTFHEDESLQVDFSQYITDIDEDDLSLEAEGNTNINIDINDLIVNFSAIPDWFGSENVTFTVNDNQGRAIASDSTIVTVIPANDPPEITLPNEISLYEDNSLSVDFSQYISDDGNYLMLDVDQTENLTIGIDSLQITIIPDLNWNGQETASFTVYDGEYYANDSVRINVIPVNDPPQINAPLEFVFSPSQQYSYNFQNYVFDLDGDQLTLSVTGNQNIDIVINNLMVVFTTNEWLGVETVTFTVDDGMGRATSFDMTNLIVTDDTQMPVIYLPDSFTFNEDGSQNIDFSQYIYNDSQIQVILYADGNENVIVEIDTLTNFVNLSAIADWNGSEMVTFTINAPGYDHESSDVTEVIVNPVNDLPVINFPIGGFSFLEDDSLTVDLNLGEGYITDVDNDSVYINLEINNPQPNIMVDFADNIALFTAIANFHGIENFTINVNDGSDPVVEVFDVTVIPVNDPPSIKLPEEGFSFPENEQLQNIDFAQYVTEIDEDDYIISLVNETDYIFAQVADTLVTLTSTPYWNGSEALVFSVNDQHGRAIDIDTVMVEVTPVNNPPYIANPIPDLEIMENGFDNSVNLNWIFADYDTDPDLNVVVNDSLFFSFDEPGENSFNISIENGEVTIAPLQNWFGVKTLYFIATDTIGETAVDSTEVTVVSINYPPEVILDIPDFDMMEDFSDFSLDLNLYFDDQDGDILDYTAQFDINQISAQVNDNILTISSLPDWNGQAGVIIRATDPDSLYITDGFVVNVSPVNDPPQIELPDQFDLQEDIESIFDFENWASDCDDDALIIGNDIAENLIITYNANIPTEVHIISEENWFGNEFVFFYVNDQSGRLIDSDSVLVSVTPVNDPPVIDVPNEGFSFTEDGELQVDFTSYIDDIDSENLSIIISEGTHIQTLIEGYIVTFSADENWNGTEIHNFTVGDNQFYASETAPIVVTPVNDSPTINLPPSLNTLEDTPLVEDFEQYIDDEDNLISELTLSTIGTYPDVAINISGTEVTFDPVQDFNGNINIVFLLEDNAGGSASDNINLIITPVNDPPSIVLPDSLNFNEDTNYQVDFGQYIEDIDEDPLYLSVQDNVNINVAVSGLQVIFSADLHWNGTETLTFIISDEEQRLIDTDVVDVIVDPVNDAPQISLPANFRFNEDSSSEIDFLSYVSDVDTPFEELALQVSGNLNVNVQILNFDVTLSALENWYGSEEITFTVYETITGLSNSDQVNAVVNPVNDPPVISLPSTVNVDEGGSLMLDMADFIDDIDNTYAELELNTEGTEHLNVNIEGLQVTLLAETDWNGFEIIEFTVEDTAGLVDTDNMRVNILPTNDPPTINFTEPFIALEDSTLTIDMDNYVGDVDGDELMMTVSGNENINVTFDGLATTIQGTLNWFGEEMLIFTVSDNVTRLTASDSVLVIIEPVNDPPVLSLPTSLIAIEEEHFEFDFTPYIFDVDGDSLTMAVESVEIIDTIIVDGFNITIEDDTWNANENVLFTITDGIIDNPVFDVVNITLIPKDDIPNPGDVIITLPSFDGLEFGEEFILPVNVNILIELWEIYGFEFSLIFDSKILELIGWNFEGTLGDTTRVVAGEREIFIEKDFPTTLFGTGSLINIEFKYISNEYEQDVVELDDFEFHSPAPFEPIVFDGVVNNDFPTLNDSLVLYSQYLLEDFEPLYYNLNNYFVDNTPNNVLEFSVSSSSPDFAVTIQDSIMGIISIPDKHTDSDSMKVTLVCYDRFLYSIRDTFGVTVYPVNDPPVIDISQDFEIATDGQLQVDFNEYISDVDNNVDTEVTINLDNITVSPNPEKLIDFVLNDKVAGFYAPHNWSGLNNFRIVAYDLADSSQAVFNIRVVYQGSDDIHCYPNPMNTNDGTRFVINTVADLADIKITIFDFAGRKVCSENFNSRGANEISWMGYTDGWNGMVSGTKLARGVYFARVVGYDDFGEIAAEHVIKVVIKE